MPAVNFSPLLARMVERGEKKMTIRRQRKNPFMVGGRFIAYEGMRTKRCRKLGEWVITSVVPVRIDHNYVSFMTVPMELGPEQLESFAQDDGFQCWEDMEEFFRRQYGLPFFGVLITWGPLC